VALPWATWERLLIWLVVGMIVYFTYARARAARVRANPGLRPVDVAA
jgi:hypothetical protein